jgi:type I site-specific restriction-modification system R (restriction) subunit
MEGVIFAKIDLSLDEAVNEPFIENPNIKNFIPNLIENIENQKNKKKINSLILEDEKEKENEMVEEDSAVEECELNEEINNKATSMPSNLLKGL